MCPRKRYRDSLVETAQDAITIAATCGHNWAQYKNDILWAFVFCFRIGQICALSSAQFERARHDVWTVPTRCACKNTSCIHTLMVSEFCLLIFFVLVWNHLLNPWSARRPPIRFERMATVLITDCVHTPGDCTRATSRWCASKHLRVAFAASTPSHLLCPRRRYLAWWSSIEMKKQIWSATGLNILAKNRRNWHVNFIDSGLKVAKTRF